MDNKSAKWTNKAWCADWIRALPNEYWDRMVSVLTKNFFAWIPEAERPSYLESEGGRRQLSDQLFVRMSQASTSFVSWLEQHRSLSKLRVLEIGCGAGSCTAALARAGATVTGFDISPDYLEVNQVRLEALGLHAKLVCVPSDWLSSLDKANLALSTLPDAAMFDMVVCYALLEHLLPDERLVLLGALRSLMASASRPSLVIYETPNRFAPLDWHSTKLTFPDALPDELALAYLKKRLDPAHPWHPKLAGMGSAAGRSDWYRGGRGASYHEFDVALGLENISVVQDGYAPGSDHIRNFHPDKEYEAALERVLSRLDPPVPRGFCRPTLDLVISWRDNRPT